MGFFGMEREAGLEGLLERLVVRLSSVLMGVRPGALVWVGGGCRGGAGLFCRRRREVVAALGLECRVLRRGEGGALVLFYGWEGLREALAEPERAAFLRERAYPAGAELEELVGRCRRAAGFPHEVGVFLGYPLKDVRGFIAAPERCLAVPRGLWRVWGDVEESLALMARVRRAEELVRGWLREGVGVRGILERIQHASCAA